MDPKVKKVAVIYTDGACTKNGQPEEARAGVGVFWPDKPENNLSLRLDGRQTNQRAEINAAMMGITDAAIRGYDEVIVHVDSNYVKRAAEEWIPRWEREGWSKPVKNKEDFKLLWDAMKDVDTKFVKVESSLNHADSLAKDGAKRLSGAITKSSSWLPQFAAIIRQCKSI